ncbi:TIGD6 [Cordylochernes scorpioides]|uniref:TIGD6 n=1 Tax=Cordylochernes scorpioides TaxID=51811 RepID=A0ABY6KCK8_9ARAC|nr:TIGD6 [Cordylochernes scorpioides]
MDANSVATWKGEIIPSLLAKYSPQDIFNADETGLFYKLLPNQTMTIRSEKCEGDNCPAHQIPEELQNIEIRFFPSLTTSALQPCDMGIIKALKDQYRKRMISYHLLGRNAQVHLLFSISWLEAAWVGVSSSTIKNCFSHSGFVIDKAMEEVVEEEMNRCFEALKQHQAIDVNYIDFLEVDKDVQVTGEQSIEEIVKEIMGKEEDEEVEPTEKDLNKTSITSAVDAINTIKTLCFLKDISEEERHACLLKIDHLEYILNRISEKKQTSIKYIFF